MTPQGRWYARATCLLLCWGLLGCGGEPPPQAGDAVQLTPAMETMKAEMLKSYNASKTKGRGRVTPPGRK